MLMRMQIKAQFSIQYWLWIKSAIEQSLCQEIKVNPNCFECKCKVVNKRSHNLTQLE